MKTKRIVFALLLASLAVAGCKKDPIAVNEEENITTVRIATLSLTDSTKDTFFWKDIDGAGGQNPTIDTIVMDTTTTYSVNIAFLDESGSVVEDITTEIQEEGVEHQLFFSVTNGLVSFLYDDADANGKPIGLKSKFTTTTVAGTESVKVILRHEPTKSASGVSTGDITNAGGETDIEVDVPLKVVAL